MVNQTALFVFVRTKKVMVDDLKDLAILRQILPDTFGMGGNQQPV